MNFLRSEVTLDVLEVADKDAIITISKFPTVHRLLWLRSKFTVRTLNLFDFKLHLAFKGKQSPANHFIVISSCCLLQRYKMRI